MPKRTRSRKRSHRGGSGNYSSATTYNEYVNGGQNAQYDRVFDGASSGTSSNIIIGAQGQNTMGYAVPSNSQTSLIQSAGKRRRKKGGFLGSVIQQAVVPFGLLAMQQSYRRKKSNHNNNTKKHFNKKRFFSKKRY